MCTEECGRLEPPDEQELLRAFETLAGDAFTFLGREHSLQLSSLVTFDVSGPGRVPTDAAEASYPFLAVLEFTGANPPVRLSYGGRDYQLELEIAANGSGHHPLPVWLDALGIEIRSTDDSGVATPAALARHGQRLARELSGHFTEICNAGPEVVDRLAAQGARTPARLNRTRERAHAAFAEGEYHAYVELLAPFESALTVTERRKLDFARAKRAAA